jgi:hypothetical protein
VFFSIIFLIVLQMGECKKCIFYSHFYLCFFP